MWSDDGIVLRLLESDEPPDVEQLLPSADEIEDMVVRELGGTAMFAAHFRENAARALLLPKRQPGRRRPLWLQRRKSADLLQVASRYERFPILLETYRECLRDVFDLAELKRVLSDVQQRNIRVHVADTRAPSPFAAALLFNYIGNYMYEGDAPLVERRAAALALDHAQLRELLGDADFRELLDADVVDQLALELQRLTASHHIRHEDALHDLLLQLGDLTHDEIAARAQPASVPLGAVDGWIDKLGKQRRIIEVRIAGESRWIAAEDTARYRDGLGVVPPLGLPEAFLGEVDDAMCDLVSRFARTHVPFYVEDVAQRFGLGAAAVRMALLRLAEQGRVVDGEFLPHGRGRQWCDAGVLKTLKQRSLAALRKQIEPVEPAAFARFLIHWQGANRRRRGLDGLLDVIEQLQGVALPASDWESRILPARVQEYQPGDLDALFLAGEIVWHGRESLGPSNGRVAFCLKDMAALLSPERTEVNDELELRIRELLANRGALLFDEIQTQIGGFRNDTLDALWRLVWTGWVTNDTLAPIRSLLRGREATSGNRRAPARRGAFRSRRKQMLPGSEGRWSLLETSTSDVTPTQRQTAIAGQLIERYGVVTREIVAGENIAGRFAGLYPVYKAMEEAGRVRRGYFIAGQGAAQFAAPGAEDRLRQHSPDSADDASVMVLAATDPANPYGAALRWPETPEDSARPQRAAGARVILQDGRLIGYLGRSGHRLLTFLPDDEPLRSRARASVVSALAEASSPQSPTHLQTIDGVAAVDGDWVESMCAAGFAALRDGLIHRGEAAEVNPRSHSPRRPLRTSS